MPTVSVIIPNYNHAAFLEERISSVLKQSFTDFEIIVLDDGSTDESILLLSKYKHHPKVSHWEINENNAGNVFAQWVKGIDIAKGELIWLAESDDSAEITFLEKCVNQLFSHPTTAICYTGSHVIDKNSVTIEIISPCKLPEEQLSGKQMIKTRMLASNGILNASAVVFRKDRVTREIKDHIQKFSWLGDWAFWCDILLSGEICLINEPLNKFRLHENNLSQFYYNKGFSFKEGLGLSITMQKRAGLSDIKRGKLMLYWNLLLAKFYAAQLKKRKMEFVFFKPALTCIAFHAGLLIFLPYYFLFKKENKSKTENDQ